MRSNKQRLLLWVIITSGLVGSIAALGIGYQRLRQCAYVPLLAEDLLPNADLAQASPDSPMPLGWVAGAPGVQPGDFAVDGDNRSIHLMGIANYVQTPSIPIQPNHAYCFTGRAITDANSETGTRLRPVFHWLNDNGDTIQMATGAWQPVVLWQAANPPDQWSLIQAAFVAPAGATQLVVRLHPASDDRIYLDAMHLRPTLVSRASTASSASPITMAMAMGDAESLPLARAPLVRLRRFPNGKDAAVSFSFDWETTMAGLIHSRSVGDPHVDTDPLIRGLRMREGITNTLDIFRPYGVRATYYAAGYSLLISNTNRITFLGNPTYQWATQENRWMSDHWQTTPWFSPDPYGTAATHPAWYAGDLVPLLLREGQDIQSHTFSHFYGGFVQAQDWRDDLALWNSTAANRGIPAVRSLAFPWSSSGGMSYASWDVLADAGITSVTRLSDQSQYNLFDADTNGIVREPHCRPLPGHETILACPDFYLTPSRLDLAIAQIDRALASEGTIDIWAHTEEVVSPEQQETWEHIVAYAANNNVWIAPLRTLADWQQAIAQIQITETGHQGNQQTLTMSNASTHPLSGVTLELEGAIAQVMVQGQEYPLQQSSSPSSPSPTQVMLDIAAGETLEVQIWRIP
jgi:hypothetical protein